MNQEEILKIIVALREQMEIAKNTLAYLEKMTKEAYAQQDELTNEIIKYENKLYNINL